MEPKEQKHLKGKGLRMAAPEKDILLRVSQVTSRISSLEQLLKTSVKICGQSLGVDRCSIWLADNKKRSAMIKAVYAKGRFRPAGLGATVQISKFPGFKRIISEGKVIHSPDISKLAANRFEKKFLAETKIKSFLCLPLKIKNRVLGALNFGTLRSRRAFTHAEIRLCQIIANQVAVGLENVILYKKLEDRAVQLQEKSVKVLKESEQKYRTLLENLPQLIFLKNKRSVFVSVNKNLCKSMGVKPEQIIGKTDFSFFPRGLAQKYRKDDRDILKTGKTKEIVEDYIEKGKRRIVQTVKTPVLGDDGKPIGILGIFWDITERRRMEEMVKESEKKYRTLVETAQEGIGITDPGENIVFVNRAFADLLGYGKKNLLGLNLRKISDKEEFARFRKQTGKRSKGESSRYETRLYTRTGKLKHFTLAATPIYDDKGAFTGTMGLLTDITERKKAEEALRKTEEKYRRVVENANEGIVVAQDGRLKFFNPRLMEMTGFSREELASKRFVELIHPDDRKAAVEDHLKRLKGEKLPQVFPFRFIDKKGNARWFEVNVAVIDWEGRPATLTFLSDITERRKAEEALSESVETAQAMLNASLDGALLINPDGTIVALNEVLAKGLGKIREELVGASVYDILPPEVAQNRMNQVKKVIRSKKPVRFEDERRGRYFDQSAYPVLDAEGKVVRIAVFTHDITERKRAERVLRDSEEKFRILAEHSPNMIFLNKKGNIVYANKRCEEVMGYKKEEFYSPDFDYLSLVAPEYVDTVRTKFRKHMKGEEVAPYEYAILNREGKRIEAIMSSRLITYEGEIAILGILTDITERKKVEDELRDSEHRYHSLFEDSPISLWEEDFSEVKRYLDKLKKRGIRNFRTYFENHPDVVEKCAEMVKVLDVNKTTLKLFKAKDKKELQRKLSKTFIKESYTAFKEELVSIAQGKTSFETEAFTQTLKGEKNNILIRWTVAPGSEETFSKVLVSILDITERKKAEDALKESRKFLEEIIDHIPDPLFIKNREHQWTLLNKAICEMLGYPREEMLGKSDYDFFPKKQADFFWKKDEEMFRTGKVVDIPEEPITDAQGNIHWLHTKKAPLKDSSDKISTLVGIIRDITDQKKAVETLRKSRDLNTILQISYKITQIHDLDRMLKLACRETAGALAVDRCGVFLLDEKERAGIIKAIYMKSQPHPSILGASLSVKDFPSLMKAYERKQRFLHAPQIEKAPLSRKEKEYFNKANIKSFVIVPIDMGKRLLGTFLVGSMERNRVFTDAEITFIQTLANHLAVAVENVRLMELVKEQAENVRALSQRVITAQEGERKRIAQELHDDISQNLALMKINMEMSKQDIPSELTRVIDRIKDNENLTAQTLEKVRNLTSDLRPPQLDDLGLVPTLRSYIKHFSKRTNIKVTLKDDQCRDRLPLDVEMVLYRIAQEALTNVAKHARATEVSILLEKKNNYALLTVKDNGTGFDVKETAREQKQRKGFGLFDIEERVKLLNGSFSITSKPKKGTTLHIRIPCPRGR